MTIRAGPRVGCAGSSGTSRSSRSVVLPDSATGCLGGTRTRAIVVAQDKSRAHRHVAVFWLRFLDRFAGTRVASDAAPALFVDRRSADPDRSMFRNWCASTMTRSCWNVKVAERGKADHFLLTSGHSRW